MSDIEVVFLWFLGTLIVLGLGVLLWSEIYLHCWLPYQRKRFNKLHPDWAEARNAMLDSGKEGNKLNNLYVKSKEYIDYLTKELNYLPAHVSTTVEEMIAEERIKYYEILTQIKANNKEHEKNRELFEELTKKYNYRW